MLTSWTKDKSRLEQWFAIGGILIMMTAFLPLLTYQNGIKTRGIEREANAAFMYTAVFIYTFSLIRLIPQVKTLIWLFRRSKIIIALVLLALLSTFWSADFEVTLRRSSALFGTTIFAYYLTLSYKSQQLLRLMTKAAGIALIFSVIFSIVIPEFGVHNDFKFNGLWRGVFIHKNLLGIRTNMFIVLLITVIPFITYSRKIIYFLLGLAVLCLIKAWSVQGIIGSIIAVALFSLIQFSQKSSTSDRYLVIGFLLPTVILIISFVSFFGDNLLTIFGRDLTFSGRTYIWKYSLAFIEKKLFLGYGYRAFWLGDGSPSEFISRILGYSIVHAHNGIIGITLELGLVGLVLFLISIYLNLLKLKRNITFVQNPISIFYMLGLFYILFIGITTDAYMAQNNILWVLYVVITLYLNILESFAQPLASEP